jgi:hypothetical protein
LVALGATAAVIAVISIAGSLGGLNFLGEQRAVTTRPALLAGSVCGVVLFFAIGVMIIERYSTRARQSFRSGLLFPLIGALAGFLICGLAIFIVGSQQTIFAAACGLATAAILFFVRRIGLGWRAALLMGTVAIVGAVVVVANKTVPPNIDLSLRYAAAPPDLVSVTDRMVRDAGPGGTGGGTFAAIYRLYGSQDSSTVHPRPPTFAAQIAIELGRPALWIIVTLMTVIVVLGARAVFDRGRDFFYSMGGAGIGVASLVLAFCDIGLRDTAIMILLATTLGLALAQRFSRTL